MIQLKTFSWILFLCVFSQSKLTIDRFWKDSSFYDDINDTLVKFIRWRASFNGVGFEQISWNKLGRYILMIRIDDDNDDYFNLLICSSLIKCTNKIMYNLHTTSLTPNGPFLRSQFDKNERKIRIFKETRIESLIQGTVVPWSIRTIWIQEVIWLLVAFIFLDCIFVRLFVWLFVLVV